MAMRSYILSHPSEPQLTIPDEVYAATKGNKFSKAPGPNGVPNRSLNHLHKRAFSFLAHVFNAVLHTHHVPQAWKHARVISILKPVNDPALPSSYRHIRLLDMIGKLFEKILLTKILSVVNERQLLGDEQNGFRPGHSTSLQLARLH